MDQFPKFKAAAVQAAPIWQDRERSADKACSLIAEAGRHGAQLVAFPEVWIPGYPSWAFLGTPLWGNEFFAELYANSVEIPSPTTASLCEAAKQAGAYVVMGMNEREGGTLYITQLLIDPEGNILGRHRKLKPTHAERTVYGQGDGSDLRVFDTPIGRLGALNCWEHLQPLMRYAMFSVGEQVHVASWPSFSLYRKQSYALGAEACMGASRQYALEGSCFVLAPVAITSQEMVDRLADTPERAELIEVGGGGSCIFGPDGTTIAGPGPWDEEADPLRRYRSLRHRPSEEFRRSHRPLRQTRRPQSALESRPSGLRPRGVCRSGRWRPRGRTEFDTSSPPWQAPTE